MGNLKQNFINAKRAEKEAYAKLKISARKFFRNVERGVVDPEVNADYQMHDDDARNASWALIRAQKEYNKKPQYNNKK